MSDPSLSARHVTVTLGKETRLHDVSLTVRTGDLFGIAGPNGAGKTSLLKTLLGLIAPSKGRILLNGHPLDRLSPSDRGQKIAYLPQERALPYGFTVEDVIRLGRLPYKRESTSLQSLIIENVMTDLKLQELRNRRVETLSGGEKARICLARALATESPFLLIDEPTASLDPSQALNIMNILVEKAQREKKAIFIILHDLPLLAQYCTKIAFLKKGRIVAQGAPHEVITEDVLQKTYDADLKLRDNISILLRS